MSRSRPRFTLALAARAPRSSPPVPLPLRRASVAAARRSIRPPRPRVRPGCRRRPRQPRRSRSRVRVERRPSSSSGLGYIPSVQFAQFYLAQQTREVRGRRARRRVPEQDRSRPHPAGRRGRPSTSGSATERASSRPSAMHPGAVRGDHLREVPEHRVRQGVVGDQDRRRPQGQEDRHAGALRVGLDHAPGPARVGRTDHRRCPDRRVPRLHAARGRRARRRRRCDRVRQQRAGPDGTGRDTGRRPAHR